jgi:hypothetical protein
VLARALEAVIKSARPMIDQTVVGLIDPLKEEWNFAPNPVGAKPD